MYKHVLVSLAIFFFLIDSNNLKAQTYNFKNYNVIDGLPQSYIYTINQGPKGFLWIGTGDGLARYNGVDFKSFNTDNGLPENFTVSSMIDSKGNIWFGFYQGSVAVYDGKAFKEVNFENTVESPVNCIFEDSHGNIWFGTKNDGVHIYKPGADNIQHADIKKFKQHNINKIAEDKNDNILLATGSGLYKLTPDNMAVAEDFPKLSPREIIDFLPDSAGHKMLLLTKDHRVYKYYSNDKAIRQIKINRSDQVEEASLIKKGNDNFIWIGTFGNGISKYKLENNQLNLFETFDKASGLSNNYVKSFFIDREDNVWIGTYGGGIDHHLHSIFILYNGKDGFKNENVNAIQLDNNKNLWFGDGNQLVNYQFKKNYNDYIVNTYGKSNDLPNGTITTLLWLNTSEILIGYKNKGLWKFDINNEIASRWLVSVNNEVNKINHITRQGDSLIWIATPIGAYKYDIVHKSIVKYNMADGLAHNHIRSIFIDSENNIWFATHGSGISVYEYDEAVFKTYKFSDFSVGMDIHCFAEDKKGNIWVGTYGQGLFKFDGRKPVKSYNKKSGLGSNFCYTLISDKNKNIWVGHKTGVTKINTQKEIFTFYHQRESFLNAEVNHNAICKDSEDNIWFGTNKGAIKYRPRFDKINKVEPVTHITNLKLFYQEEDWSKFADTLTDFDLPLNAKFSYNDNHLTFYFIGISLKNLDQVSYKYKLEGIDDQWSLTTKENFTTYSQLGSGTYTFKVKSRNSDGIWNKTPAEYSFVIETPFWQTWWFISLITFFAIIMVIVIIKIRTERLKKQKIILERDKKRLEKEIKERKLTEAKLQRSEEQLTYTNEELNTLLYKASHDLKAPLTSTSGLINIGKIKVKEKEALQYFDLISTSLAKLDNILKKLTHVAEMKKNPLKSYAFNLNNLFDEIINELGKKCNLDGYNIVCNVDSELVIYSDKQVLYYIIFNVLENSIRFCSDNPAIEINAALQNKGLKIIMRDNGIGIPEEFHSKVFDMFYRASRKSAGSGLGLYVVKNAIEKINGEIHISSAEGSGTEFSVYIPGVSADNHDDFAY